MIVNCRDFVSVLDAHLAGELPFLARLTFYLHLSVCRHCRKYIRGYRETIRAGQIAMAPTDDPVPEAVPEDLVRAVTAALRKMPPPPSE